MQNKNPEGQILNPAAPFPASGTHDGVIWTSKDLSSSTPLALPFVDHMTSLLGWLCLLPIAFLSRLST
jgi:hypothetical protein